MPPTISVTIASQELGLAPGDLAQIDAAVRRFPREVLVLRIVSVLNALSALGKHARNLSVDFAQILPVEARGRLLSSLRKDNALFLEPWQHLVVLRRTLEASPAEVKPELDFLTESGENCYFDICRFASDTLRGLDPFADQPATADPDAWVKIAANFMPWIWMLNPPDIAAWIGRSEIMFRQLPEIDEKVRTRVAALNERFPKALNGLSFNDTTSLIQFLSLWSIRLTNAFMPFKGPFGPGDTKLVLIVVAISHSWNHYGQVVPYLRMNNVLPPRRNKGPTQSFSRTTTSCGLVQVSNYCRHKTGTHALYCS
jgi:hypothetical protein